VIAKITRGTDLLRLVRYLFGPGKANEHTDQRAVALAATLDAPVGESLTTPVGDRQLSDTEWARIAQAAMEHMGFTEASG